MVLKYVIIGIVAISFIGLGGLSKTSQFFNSIKSTQKDTPSSPQGTSLPDVASSRPVAQESNANAALIQSKLPMQAIVTRNEIVLPPNSTSQNIISLTNSDRKIAQKGIEAYVVKQNPILTANTSLPGALKTTGPQLKREEPVVITNARLTTTATSSKLQQTIVAEQNRAESIFAKLYGNVQNPKFATGGK